MDGDVVDKELALGAFCIMEEAVVVMSALVGRPGARVDTSGGRRDTIFGESQLRLPFTGPAHSAYQTPMCISWTAGLIM